MDGDAEEPRGERGGRVVGLAEGVEAAPGANEGLLGDVLGVLVVADEAQGHSLDPGPVDPDQVGEGSPVPQAGPLQALHDRPRTRAGVPRGPRRPAGLSSINARDLMWRE